MYGAAAGLPPTLAQFEGSTPIAMSVIPSSSMSGSSDCLTPDAEKVWKFIKGFNPDHSLTMMRDHNTTENAINNIMLIIIFHPFHSQTSRYTSDQLFRPPRINLDTKDGEGLLWDIFWLFPNATSQWRTSLTTLSLPESDGDVFNIMIIRKDIKFGLSNLF
jgi:hypothetical protein